MVRIVAMLIAVVLGLTILRSILSAIGRLISSFVRPQTAQQPPQHPGAGQEPAAQLLRRCALCGTYTPDSTAKRANGADEVIYFCSTECQSKAAVKA